MKRRAPVNRAHSRRFAPVERVQRSRQRLECEGSPLLFVAGSLQTHIEQSRAREPAAIRARSVSDGSHADIINCCFDDCPINRSLTVAGLPRRSLAKPGSVLLHSNMLANCGEIFTRLGFLSLFVAIHVSPILYHYPTQFAQAAEPLCYGSDLALKLSA